MSLFIGPTATYVNTKGPVGPGVEAPKKKRTVIKLGTPYVASEYIAKETERREKAKGPVETKKSKIAGVGTVEEWLEKLVKIHAIEEGYTDDNKVDEWLSKIQDNGDYNEYQEEAIMAYGGHSDVAEKLYKNLLSKGYTKSSLISAFKDMAEDGTTMFEDLIN